VVRFDSNHWKTFVMERLGLALGNPGAMGLYGDDEKAHRLYAEHLTAEAAVKTEGRGRTVYQWKLPPHRPDNHWLDTLVGCAVGASICGAQVPGVAPSKAQGRRRVSALELQRKARGR